MHDYCLARAVDADRAQDRGTAGGGDGTGTSRRQHQSLLHFVGNAAWSDPAMLAKSLPSRKRG
jgi:hypothetical protein